MAMSKKDYEAIAGIIRHWNADQESERFELDLCEMLAAHMRADNPRFSRARFLAACRGEDAKDSAGRKVSYAPGR